MHGVVHHERKGVLILERMDGDVLDLLEEPSFDMDLALDIFLQTCEAVQFCHQNQVAHLDIKPENLLYRTTPDGITVKLTDFGSSVRKVSEVAGFFGTLYYV